MGFGIASWANVFLSFATINDWTEDDIMNYDVIMTGSIIAGGSLGSVLSGQLMKFGKLRVILVNNLILILSILVCMNGNILLICFGRFFWGFAFGSFTVICGKYTIETCPMEYLGPLAGSS